jgi:hypothetical protein
MDHRSLASWFALVVLAGLPSAAAAQGAPAQPALSGYAILGLESVRLARGVRVRPGAVGTAAGTVRLARGVQVPGSVVADSVLVARRVQVGRLFCALVSGGGFGAVGNPTGGIPGCLQMTKPVVEPALLAPVAVTPGTADLVVPPGSGTFPRPPGAYGVVQVGSGALLEFAGGAYQVRSIRLAARARLACLDDCQIAVLETVRLGRGAQLGADRDAQAEGARIDVAAGGDIPAVRAGPNAAVAATIVAPTGAVVLGRGGEYRGAYIGRSVTVRRRSRVIEDSAFPPPPRDQRAAAGD